MKKIFNGDLRAEAGVVYDYEVVTGYIYAQNSEAKFPNLTSVGGYIDAREYKGEFPKNVKQNDIKAKTKCRKSLDKSFEKSGHSFADNILSAIVQKRGNVCRVKICGKTTISYLVTQGEAYSHGATLSEARNGLMFKISKRDTSEFKSWTLDKIISKREAIRSYRMITGACEQGVRQWVSQRETPNKISVGNVIKLTEGEYGYDAYAKFFQEVK